MKNKVYIVTVHSVKDAPFMEPTEANLDKLIDVAKSAIASIKLEDLETKFDETQNAIQTNIINRFYRSANSGEVFADFKTLIEQEKENANLEIIKAKYEEYIKLFEDFKDKYEKAIENLSSEYHRYIAKKKSLKDFNSYMYLVKSGLDEVFVEAKERLEKLKKKF